MRNKNNGFTLIELLAVIVILAIIAIIATPIVLNIIKEAKENSVKLSASAYIDTVEKTYVNKLMSNQKLENKSYKIQELDEIGVKVKGEKPNGENDYVILQNGKAIEYELTIQGYTIAYKDGNLIVDSGKDNDSKDKITPLDYTVTFMVDEKPYQIVSVIDNCSVYAPTINPTSQSGLFNGWKIGEEYITFPYTPVEDMEIVAHFQTVRQEMELYNQGDFLAEQENGVIYTKVNDGWSVAGYTKSNHGYITLVAKTEEAALMEPYTHKGTITYNGVTYYYSGAVTVNGATRKCNNVELPSMSYVDSKGAPTTAINVLKKYFYST